MGDSGTPLSVILASRDAPARKAGREGGYSYYHEISPADSEHAPPYLLTLHLPSFGMLALLALPPIIPCVPDVLGRCEPRYNSCQRVKRRGGGGGGGGGGRGGGGSTPLRQN
ncbi:uncharacterized protein V6R79_021421 [Siganus canaliculatus]